MSVTDTPGSDLSINQLHYVEKIITRFGYDELSEVDTPMVEGLSLRRNPDAVLYEDLDIRSKIGVLCSQWFVLDRIFAGPSVT